jgi:hypothetical protein
MRWRRSSDDLRKRADYRKPRCRDRMSQLQISASIGVRLSGELTTYGGEADNDARRGGTAVQQAVGWCTVTGWPRPDEPTGKIELVLNQQSTLDADGDLRDGLSAVVRQGDHFWVANDEATSLERLTLETGDRAGAHHSFDLTDFLDLPGDKGEIDIDGLDVDGEIIWLVGSHSSVRKQIKSKREPADALRSVATVEVSRRRQVLARLPTRTLLGGRAGERLLPVFGGGSTEGLLDLLADDPHLGRFLSSFADTASWPIPGKDNGIDCEGLAVLGNRVFIGLRGPVLRGWAMIVELEVGDRPSIEPQPIGPGNRRYRKHFLDLRGLGVRDLCRHGDDLLVLAGPTMALDGHTAVFRWRGALTSQEEAVLHRGELSCEFEVAFGKGQDRAEGITVLEDGRTALVVFDSPADERKRGRDEVRANVFDPKK